jgi:hypothetical protein
MGGTAAGGAILAGSGTTSDVTIENKAGASVISIPTGTTTTSFAGSIGVGIATPTAGTVLDAHGTGAAASSIILPRDTTANRPTGVNGMLRYNNTTNFFEGFANGLWGSVPTTISAQDQVTQTANIALTTMVTPPANSFYLVTCITTVTTAATTSSTLPNCVVSYTDVDSNTAVSRTIAASNAGNTVATTFGQGQMVIFAKSGVNVQYQTTGYASVGAATMQYSVHARIVQQQ